MASISIKPEREYLREIAAKICDGKYAIPVFQRDFVWNKEQVLDLFDSISKGYPIGSIILWKPEKNEDLRAKDIISDEITTVEAPADFYVLDGRQRLTTFYGCVTKLDKKDDALKVVYNLDKDCFEYAKGRNNKEYLLELPDVYDTLSLLNRLQGLMSTVQDRDKLTLYVERAKAMNARLQSYEIGEVLIENCSLDEAATVFSRINSKGTAISKVSMLQAIYYKDGQTPLLSDEISDLINSLAVYGFDGLKENDILNCCCQYVGKNFYDGKIMEELVKNDLTTYLDSIREDITRAVQFLHDDCLVLSHKMLPYAKQLVGITTFFKEIKNPTASQLQELKKWFFYTTVCQSFQNSSLTAVRPLYRNLDKFIQGESETAMKEYEPIKLPSLDFHFSTTSALSNLLMITLATEYKKNSGNEELAYNGQGKLLRDSSAGVFLHLTNHDKQLPLRLSGGEEISDAELAMHALTKDMVNLYRQGNTELFAAERQKLLTELECRLLKDVGIELQNHQ